MCKCLALSTISVKHWKAGSGLEKRLQSITNASTPLAALLSTMMYDSVVITL